MCTRMTPRASSKIMRIKASALWITCVTASAAPNVLLTVAACVVLLALLVYVGIAMPAVWSAKPSRRLAASAVLGQILEALQRHEPNG
jgi:hypothetical protein